MNNKWQIISSMPEELSEDYPTQMKVILQLLYNRGIEGKKQIKEFLNADYERCTYDPFLFNQMEEATDLIIKNIKEQKKIVIYGDYDVDGVTSSALLYEILILFKAKVSSYIPDRVDEGYGLNIEAMEEIARNNTSLIITVDCGIRSKKEVERAKELGLEVVISDHHVPPEKSEIPDCIIINPSLEDEKYPFKKLAGVGVAFKIAKALISKSKLNDEQKELLEYRLLDLVAVGTVSDCVSLLGENRALVKEGLKALNETRRTGLEKLLEVAQIKNKILDAWNIGFQIGPRINAAGRIDHANYAFDLLITKDAKKASELANKLNQLNQERQQITTETIEKVEKQIEKDSDDKVIIGVCDLDVDAWNEGVTGLVAGRICEKYYLPTLLITKTKDGYKGSGRSIEELNIIEVIEECKELLDKYGGHPAACGFSLSERNLENFIQKVKDIVNKKLGRVELNPKINIEADVDIEIIDEDFLEELDKFKPFGQDNLKPKFLSRNLIIKDIIKMGSDGQHIKFRIIPLSSGQAGFWAISFNGSDDLKEYKIGDKIDMVYYIDRNEFNGRSEIQLKIIDLRISKS